MSRRFTLWPDSHAVSSQPLHLVPSTPFSTFYIKSCQGARPPISSRTEPANFLFRSYHLLPVSNLLVQVSTIQRFYPCSFLALPSLLVSPSLSMCWGKLPPGRCVFMRGIENRIVGESGRRNLALSDPTSIPPFSSFGGAPIWLG